jgi:hypothetical protein
MNLQIFSIDESHQVGQNGQLGISIRHDKLITLRAMLNHLASSEGFPEYWVSVFEPGPFSNLWVQLKTISRALQIVSYKTPVKILIFLIFIYLYVRHTCRYYGATMWRTYVRFLGIVSFVSCCSQ